LSSQAGRGGILRYREIEILKGSKRQSEKIARAAGRIEDAIAAEACPELGVEATRVGQQPGLFGRRSCPSASLFGLPDFGLDALPFQAQWRHNDGLDNLHDRRLIGVVDANAAVCRPGWDESRLRMVLGI